MSKQTKKNTKPAAVAEVVTPVAESAKPTKAKAKTTTPAVVADDETPLDPTEAAAVDAEQAKSKRTTKSKARPAAKTEPETKPTAEPAALVDAFGCRVGSKAARVAAVLTKEPQTMKAIMEASGQTTTFYNLMKKLIAAGKIVRTEDGMYRLP